MKKLYWSVADYMRRPLIDLGKQTLAAVEKRLRKQANQKREGK